MANEDGSLTPAEMENFRTWLEARWKPPPACPVCEKKEWVMGGHVLKLEPRRGPRLDGSTVLIIGGGLHVPVLAIFCANCAYTMFFNLAMTTDKIVDKPESQRPTDAGSKESGNG